MRRNVWLAVGVLLVLSACSGGDASSAGPAPPASSTTSSAAPTTSTTMGATTTTRPPATTAPSTTIAPVLVNGTPQGTATPARAAVGANGVGCVEAEALVGKVGAQLRSVGGPARPEADGWVCSKTGESTGPGLPFSSYECVNGTKKVTFRRY